MKTCFQSRFVLVLLLLFFITAGSALAETREATSTANPASTGDKKAAAVRAYPRVLIGFDRELEYVALFSSDGKFKPLTKFSRYVDTMKTASVHDNPDAPPPVTPAKRPHSLSGPRQSAVVEDFKPPAHAVEVMKGTSLVRDLRDSVVSFVYGPEYIFKSPQDVTTDSRQRVIITDPDGHAVHVLDSKNKTSFSIVGGKGKRLQTPNGVAVDGNDNIYVSDYDLGMVLVYDTDGRFLRYIGDFKGENLYQGPAGIAIDRKAGRIYLIDRPRNLLLMLDLEGHELARFGQRSSREGELAVRHKSGAGHGEFLDPSEVIIHNGELIVLDAGSRLQIFDLDGSFRNQFSLTPGQASGLCADSKGIFYVSREATDAVEAYDHEGRLLISFGRTGDRYGEFDSPAGLWADASDRIYIVDSDNLRLQIFQLHAPTAREHGDPASSAFTASR